MGRPRKAGTTKIAKVENPVEAAFLAAGAKLKGLEHVIVREMAHDDGIIVSSGHPFIDYVLGGEIATEDQPAKPGGLILGRQYEIAGPESSGKGFFSYQAAIQVMRNLHGRTGRVAWFDEERSHNESFFRKIGGGPGLDAKQFTVFEPNGAEETSKTIAWLAAEGCVDLIVVDSVAALIPEGETVDEVLKTVGKGEKEKDFTAGRIGAHAQMMSRMLRALNPVCARTKTAILWINQIRTGMGPRGAYETTTGGNALKFYCSIRLGIRRAEFVKVKKPNPFTGEVAEEIVAIKSRITCVKNKIGRPGREIVTTFALNRGYDLDYDLLTCAVQNGWISERGAGWMDLRDFAEVAGEERVQGMANLYKLLLGNQAFRDALQQRVFAIARGTEREVDPSEAEDDEDDSPEDEALQGL